MKRTSRKFVGDFETTVYDGQEKTEVWASAIVEIGSDEVLIHHSIEETLNYLIDLKCNLIVYYHNLKFDGSFWLDFLIKKGFKQALNFYGDTPNEVEWIDKKNMENNTFSYAISAMGLWYSLTLKVNGRYIEFRDSLKLLPFSVKRIGEAFKTKHQKLEMEYKGYRYAGCEITEEEKKYIANDVLVVKEALEIMFEQGHKKLTIGSCCLDEFKSHYSKPDYDELFPDMYEIELDPNIYGDDNAGNYIRRSYKGGWCYLVKGKECKLYDHGTTADVNSLYPSMMSSESGNYYPVGKPTFFTKEIPSFVENSNRYYYFVRIRTRFYLKEGMLPFISIKGNIFYKSTESLETSDIYNKRTGEYLKYYTNIYGEVVPTTVTLTLTMTDFNLIKKHYNLVDFEVLDGCYFNQDKGIFDTYMSKYKKIKQESKGAMRELAKLFLNNLYGKMASNKNSSFKMAYEKGDGSIGYTIVSEFNKKPGYIPIGSAITSYARNFTINAAQLNYHGKNSPGFIYADTDSIHCDLFPDEIVGIKVHPTDFCAWKLESCWDIGWFVRQKTYIEHVLMEDLEYIDNPYYNIKAAGMPKKCKDLFEMSIKGDLSHLDELNEEEKRFVKKKRTLRDFNIGLQVPGKLLPKHIDGGIVLEETTFTML